MRASSQNPMDSVRGLPLSLSRQAAVTRGPAGLAEELSSSRPESIRSPVHNPGPALRVHGPVLCGLVSIVRVPQPPSDAGHRAATVRTAASPEMLRLPDTGVRLVLRAGRLYTVPEQS